MSEEDSQEKKMLPERSSKIVITTEEQILDLIKEELEP